MMTRGIVVGQIPSRDYIRWHDLVPTVMASSPFYLLDNFHIFATAVKSFTTITLESVELHYSASETKENCDNPVVRLITTEAAIQFKLYGLQDGV